MSNPATGEPTQMPPLVAAPSASFVGTLHADRPADDRAEKMGLYGWLIGRWEMSSLIYKEDGTSEPGEPGEIHFGWVLGGRAIQDVWILPGRFHGTTLRVYDPGIDGWHILWSDPLRQYHAAADRPGGRRRHRAGGAGRIRRRRALALHGDHGGVLPLDRRALIGWRRDLADADRDASSPDRLSRPGPLTKPSARSSPWSSPARPAHALLAASSSGSVRSTAGAACRPRRARSGAPARRSPAPP